MIALDPPLQDIKGRAGNLEFIFFLSEYFSTNPCKTSFPSFILEKGFTILNDVTLGTVVIFVATGKFFWANLVLTRVT